MRRDEVYDPPPTSLLHTGHGCPDSMEARIKHYILNCAPAFWRKFVDGRYKLYSGIVHQYIQGTQSLFRVGNQGHNLVCFAHISSIETHLHTRGLGQIFPYSLYFQRVTQSMQHHVNAVPGKISGNT